MRFPNNFKQTLHFILIASMIAVLSACISGPEDRRTIEGEDPTPIPTSIAVSKPTYIVERGQIVDEEVFSGRVVPVFDAGLSFAMSGVVAEVFVDRNSIVEAGVPIATLDTTPLEEERLFAQAELEIAEQLLDAFEAQIEIDRARAEFNVSLAQLDLDYASSRAGTTPTNSAQYEINRLEIILGLAQLQLAELDTSVDPALRANVAAAAFRVSEAGKAIEQAVLIAPFDGEILSLSLSEGKSVEAFETIGTIADVSVLEISSSAGSLNLDEIEEGMHVTFGFVSQPGALFDGQIRRLPFPYGSGDREDEDTSIRISFEDEENLSSFEIGDRITIRIVISEKTDSMWLPLAAIREFNGREFVVVQDDSGNQRRVDVTIGLRGRDRVEILDGLQVGEVIVGQ